MARKEQSLAIYILLFLLFLLLIFMVYLKFFSVSVVYVPIKDTSTSVSTSVTEVKSNVSHVGVPEVSANRDYKVIRDPLYPPLNRTDSQTFDALNINISERNMYVPTNDTRDNFRLVGYLINNDEKKDAGGNSWQLFARQKDRHSYDFYMKPSNNNYDIKIMLTDNMIKGDRLRDLYTIPNTLNMESPMLNATPYTYVELPKADLSVSTRYM